MKNIPMGGKIPPQAVDVEEIVLGAIMLEKDAIEKISGILTADSFYLESHKAVYNAISELYNLGKPIDIITVTSTCRKHGTLEEVGGPLFISELTNRVVSAANIEYHARIIQQAFIRRKIIAASTEAIEKAYDETIDVFDIVDEGQKSFGSLADGVVLDVCEDFSSIAPAVVNEIQLAAKNDGVVGIPTGFRELDKLFNGWCKTDLIILAARPGMGKTSFVVETIMHAAVSNKTPVGFLTLEMSKTQIVKRMVSSKSEIPHERLKSGNLHEYEWEKLNRSITEIEKGSKIWIDDSPMVNIFDIKVKARKLKKERNIGMLVVDYLQLMDGQDKSKKGQNREQEVSAISRTLKAIAKELDIPVIALSQLSRQVEQRGGDKRPILSDLRESGSLEQDADLVIFLYRPEYYGLKEDGEGNSTEGIAVGIVAKNRHGRMDEALMGFKGHIFKFHNLNEEEPKLKPLTPRHWQETDEREAF